MYAGVDGCREGWVAFVLPAQRVVEGCRSVAELLTALAGCTVIGVDMPLRPPEVGQRACDVAVRRELGRFGSSLFITPTAAALRAPTQADATRINRERGGAGVSAQAFALRHKIAELAGAEGPLIEVHPELTFHLLGPVAHRKRSWAGLRERAAVLERHGLQPWRWQCGDWASADDTLDAAAAALSAARYARGEARHFADHDGDAGIWA